MEKKTLDRFYKIIDESILCHQDPISGLIPIWNSNHAWIRDNTYAVLSIWGLCLAYKKVPDVDIDRSRGYELEKCVVKLIRGILTCIMRQSDKVERFKVTQSPADSLHAKFHARSARTVVGDNEWGHLQMDAISLYLLTLAQITASGIRLIWTLDEVDFIQNLVFYIELTYRIPDYGIWERGDKTNHGLPELNSSSVGLAKAALEALNELDLFGAQGSARSMIHVLADECQQCQTVLQSVLPRESSSKETDAALLAVIGYPAFAVDDEEVIEYTLNTVLETLEGNYGCKRFLRDGYRTPLEDRHRLYYEPWELRRFELIECEWPLFYAYLVLNAHFRNDIESADKYMEKLEKLTIPMDGVEGGVIPESYAVPFESIAAEKLHPGSQMREPVGQMVHVWSQSLYILAKMIHEGVLLPGEIDPLGRRMVTEPKPDLVVQVVVVAEDLVIKHRLARFQMHVQTFDEVRYKSGVKVFPAKILAQFYRHLGQCHSLKLSGRWNKEVGILATSKLYLVGNHKVAFTPQFTDKRSFFLAHDSSFLIDVLETELQFLHRSWKHHATGRPLLVLPVTESLLIDENFHDATQPALISTIKKLQSGYLNGTRVRMGNLDEFVSTSCITKLSFLKSADEMINRAETKCTRGQQTRLLGPADVFTASSSMNCTRSMRRQSVALAEAVFHDLRTESDADSNPYTVETDEDTIDQNSTVDDEEQLQESADHPSHNHLKEGQADSGTGIITINVDGISEWDSTPLNSQFARRLISNLSTNMMQNGPRHDLLDGMNEQDILESILRSEDLYEQTDLLYRLSLIKGIDWDTKIDSRCSCTVRDLLKEVYERAGHLMQWWLVRFTAGLLGKRVEHLAKALTDILVCQKQVTVGLPPEPREKVISAPLPPDQLSQLIQEACGEDLTMAMLTQEIIIFLSMFARTEPQLLRQMIRLRIGLIIQVMASELARILRCSAEEASLHLFGLSPCETKILLQNILSGKEFKLDREETVYSGTRQLRISQHSIDLRTRKVSVGSSGARSPQLANTSPAKSRKTSVLQPPVRSPISAQTMSMAKPESQGSRVGSMDSGEAPTINNNIYERHGQWIRRRKIDGALNRVPPQFYQRVWRVLGRVEGLLVCGRLISQNLTKEMTENEGKFALVIESVINSVQVPEFRQLIVEAICVLCAMVDNDKQYNLQLNYHVPVDEAVKTANKIFLEDQIKFKGDSIYCCCPLSPDQTEPGIFPRRNSISQCHSGYQICHNFYDTSPSGRYGTMTYLIRAFARLIRLPIANDDNMIRLDCVLQ